MKFGFLLLIVLAAFTGCCRTNCDDEIMAFPTTNNPNNIPEGGRSQMPMPGVGY